MLLVLSLLLVLGPVGVLIANIALSEQGQLGPGFEQMIHARIPWAILGPVLAGAALGLFCLVRRRRWYTWAIVPVEVALAGLLTFYFTSLSFLPEHHLALEVGDPFPTYALPDQDGQVHRLVAGTPRRPALYVFYRGDW